MSPVAARPFLRSSIGRGFLTFTVLCALMSVGVAVVSYQFSLRWFQVNKGEEKITAAQLVDAFVGTYTEGRSHFMTAEAPVPASFRAQAVERFNHTRDNRNELHLLWVGMPGREIATGATDTQMAEVLASFAGQRDPAPVTQFITVNGQTLFRTIYPSVASQQSCVDCHNQIQPNMPRWQLNDVMGASVLDVPANQFLQRTLRESGLIGLAVFLFSTAIGLVTFYLQYREFARRAASEASLRLAHEEIKALNEVLEQRVEERTAALRDLQAELLRKERLATLGQLTAVVSHELRNPLGVIRNTLYVLGEAVSKSGLSLERPIARIDRNITRCNDIIAKMLDFARTRKLDPVPRAFDQWLAEILADYAVPDGITLTLALDAPGAQVSMDAGRMQQAVVNLLDNARDAIVERGIGEERGGGADRMSRITVHTSVTTNQLVVIVEDTGGGIADELLPKIFEPLFSTKSFGTGLGLPTVKQIIEQHDGTIDVVSTPGRGTRFVVRLPLLAAERAAA